MRIRERRLFAVSAISIAALAAVCVFLLGCGNDGLKPSKRVIVLGIDGMDYAFTKKMIDAGELPNLAKLAESGGFKALGTAAPALSPVAWSNFITGLDSGGHGIFDFMHRKPGTTIPYLSTSEPEPPDHVYKLGDYQFATGGGHKLLRQGEAFWEVLAERGVATNIIRIPANFPPTKTATRELAGMGTPDILGTYGTFHFYTSKLFAFAGQDIGGGEVHEVWPEDDVLETELYGPDNPFLVEPTKLTTPLTVYRDPVEQRAKFVVGTEEVLLEAGEWSDWVPVEFEMIPSQTLPAMCRFYLRSTHEELEFYVSPLNFDPMAPGTELSHPPEFATELAELYGGRYYTQGMPEETNALRERVITQEEFMAQTKIVDEEFNDQYKLLLEEYKNDEMGGLFFYYFGNLDLVSHMMWHTVDLEHPAYDPERDTKFKDVIPDLYRTADEMVGYTLANIDEDTTLVVMSDHGFASWRRTFSLNTWLEQNGFLKMRGPYMENDPGFFVNVDWSGTKAYALGMGGLYINMKGREKKGIVDRRDRDAVLDEIAAKLLEYRDPKTDELAVTKVYHRERYYRDRGAIEIGPDMVIGYAEMVRANNDSVTGKIPPEIMGDNMSTWTGDHIMDHETVPGVFFSDRPLKKDPTDLTNLAAAILAEYGVEEFPRKKPAEVAQH